MVVMKRDETAAARACDPPTPHWREREYVLVSKPLAHLTRPDGDTYVLRLAAQSLCMFPVIFAIQREIMKHLLINNVP